MIDIHKIPSADICTELHRLLGEFGLIMPEEPDDNLGVYDDGRLIGCGFLKGDMLQGLALEDSYQGVGLSARLITELIKLAADYGRTHLHIITKPEMAAKLSGLGLREIAVAYPYAAMLEFGGRGVDRFTAYLREAARNKPVKRAALVMNCNPFTKGHRYLIQKAAEENDWVFVLVVEEEKSEFSFRDRYQLIQEGTSDVQNLTMIASGKYIVSSLTFPTYFTKQENLAAAQAALDTEIFGTVIAPALGITRRYVGSEPANYVTEVYNMALKERLPKYGIEVVVEPRLETEGKVISASAVRRALKERKLQTARQMVPDTTWNYLKRKYCFEKDEDIEREEKNGVSVAV